MANPKGQSEIRAERIPQEFALRKQGLTYEEIGKRVGADPATVCRDLRESKVGLAQLTEQEKSSYRAVVFERLSGMLDKLDGLIDQFKPLEPAVEAAYKGAGGKPDTKAIPVQLQIIDGMNKVSKSIREMLGLDAPVEVRFTSDHPQVRPFLEAFFAAWEESQAILCPDCQRNQRDYLASSPRLARFRPPDVGCIAPGSLVSCPHEIAQVELPPAEEE